MLKRLLLVAALASTPALADTLVYNVNGIQVGGDGKLQRFRGLVVGDDGKVAQLIQRTEELHRPVEHEIDGGGRTLLPGIIDAHGHVMGLGYAALTLDLTGTKSLSDLQQRLRDHAAANPGNSWIVGRGWNQELWPDKRFPTAADLDEIVPERPVALERVDGHAVVANSAALRAGGVTAGTPDPTGGKIERDASGKPTGLLIDAAADLVSGKVPPPTAERAAQALDKAQEALLSHGITATADMGTDASGWQAMDAAGKAGRLKLRVIAYAAGIDNLPQRPTEWLHGDRLRMVGIKIYGDGALGSRGAWLKRPYADRPDTRGLRFLTDAELQAQANTAASRGFQVATHAIGDAAVAQAIGTYERLGQTYGTDERWRIEHFQIADPADIKRLAPAGIIASMQPVHQTSDRLMAEQRLDPPRLAGAYAWQSVLRSGARLAFGSDYPVESPNPFHGLSAAISRQDRDAQPPGGWMPQERLTFEQALHAFTRGAAYAGFAEDRIGSLEPGKWADFILVDLDPADADPQSLARTRVIETWVAGRKVWEIGGSPSDGGERGK